MTSYSDMELQEIARWLREGFSASRIAAAFSVLRGGPVSRNAIVGIVHRNATLAAIGFANGRGVPPKAAGTKRAADEQPGSRPSGGMRAKDRAKAGTVAVRIGHATDAAQRKAAARRGPPAWLPPRLSVREAGVLVADGQAYRLEAPAPQRGPVGPQPHGAAMRFIDCLFGRCRAPLDLTLDGDPPGGTPDGQPGADMLCCGMPTKAMKSYCGYHQARFRRRASARAESWSLPPVHGQYRQVGEGDAHITESG